MLARDPRVEQDISLLTAKAAWNSATKLDAAGKRPAPTSSMSHANDQFALWILIRMYFLDHAPPHFHALYADAEALIDIGTLEVMEGQLPR